jgi:NAD-dependent DNA ligase
MREQTMTSTNLRAIQAPSLCPSCGSVLEWRNDLLYCVNANCYAKNSKRIEHWAKSLKIKGLGPATIDKLNLQSIEQIYELDLVTIVDALGSDLLGRKLFEEIQASTAASLESVLPAFGIPLIGDTATAKLCKIISNINELSETTCKAAGLGPVATKNLMTWWEVAKNNIDTYPFSFSVEKRTRVVKGTVCISGKLSSFKTKAEAGQALKEQGYQVKDSLTKDVTVLVNESGIESAKTKKAKDFGITVITNLKLFLGDSNE